MKILQLRFQNLNSLTGEWRIDFTHPVFTSEGIFAITGPTGAGKSTILDALCLALYGRTPRLNRVNKSGNEIMSRQTGNCFAEVTLETEAGRFRCHWAQHRARKKSDGELQAPKHEIVNAETGEVLETKLRNVAEQIETVTGMDFDRFTRSMLLAQGGFAAFLQAEPDARAPILEQITGTELYSQISIRVHERRSEERKALENLQAELKGIQPLNPEEEAGIQAQLDQQTQAAHLLAEDIQNQTQAIAWLEVIAQLHTELNAIEEQARSLDTRLQEFRPHQHRLQLAQLALELEGPYAGLTALRRANEADTNALNACRLDLPKLVAADQEAKAKAETAAAELERTKTSLREAQPLLKQVRALDLRLAEKQKPISAAQRAINLQKEQLTHLLAQQAADQTQLESNRQAAESLQRVINQNSADADLVEKLSEIRVRVDAIRDLNTQQSNHQNEITKAEREASEASNALAKISARRKQTQRSLDEAAALLKHQQETLTQLLAGKSVKDLYGQQSELLRQKEVIVRALEAAASIEQSRPAVRELDERAAELQRTETELKRRLDEESARLSSLQKEHDHLETECSLLQTIQDLTEARHQLEDGRPCPLCGATEHPFAHGQIPRPDQTRLHLLDTRKALKSAADAESALKVRLAQAVKDREQLGISRKQLEASIEQAQQKLDGYREQLGIAAHAAPPCDQWRPVLESMQADNADAREQIGQVLNQAEAAENARAEAAKALEKARESAAQVENATLTATHRQTAANQLLERLNQELETLQSKRASDLETLAAMVRTYHVDDLVSTGPDTMLAQLTARRDKWTARQADLADLTNAIGTLEQQLSHRGERIQTIESELTSKESELKQLQSELAQIREERQAAFGEKEPDREEHQLNLNVVAAEKSWASARDRWTEIQKDLDRLTAKKSDLERTLAERTRHLEQTENGFLQQLREKDFPDETAFRNACLPELERKQLTEAARRLADEQADLESRARATQKRLEEEQAKQLTQEPVENLRQTLEDALAQQKALQQDIGAIRQKLDNNNALKRRQAERLQAIEAQTRESGRWDRLHELIGSADGKKFRNFAQGLTFELMIGHANRQLQKMTDRYLLVRDKDQPLELNVMDNYQAGEIRSTKNLSGGESFLVSLSLALGLSQMSSRNVRVDSLFLDEGFGTLDEESLDTALETLAGLQQEGKLIGVISHVGALRERIPTQIQVTPRSGGRSALSGPGCSAGSQRN